MREPQRGDLDSESSASTVHVAIQGLHNTFYRFRRQQQRFQHLLVAILVLLCFSMVIQLGIFIYLAIQLRPHEY